MTQICEVQFKGVHTDYYTFRGDHPVREREYVVVQADRGRDLGMVKRWVDAESHTCDGGCTHAEDHPVVPPQKRILRRAAPVDVERMRELRDEEPAVCRKTRELVEEHGLNMKVSDAEWQWDKKKLTVYFTADRRVDFRALVKDMASTFRTRIELRQIGVRDEARRLGGIGRCGRELCCRTWLKDLEPVTLQLAKDQGLSLNPSQISGACGRLMNCLRYEHESYVQANKRFPKKGQQLTTARGDEEVVSWNHFQETVTLKDETGETRVVSREQLKQEITEQRASPGAAGEASEQTNGAGEARENGAGDGPDGGDGSD
ncbi:MAG: stage 0 sporulation family protein, partial [Gemmatimonadota bacterium]